MLYSYLVFSDGQGEHVSTSGAVRFWVNDEPITDWLQFQCGQFEVRREVSYLRGRENVQYYPRLSFRTKVEQKWWQKCPNQVLVRFASQSRSLEARSNFCLR